MEDMRETIEELRLNRPRSPSASSASSKRTSLSAETNAQIRQRIRKQAKSMVQKKRGSVQLAKRLLRSQTLTQVTEAETPEDFNVLDEQIEATIEVGGNLYIDLHTCRIFQKGKRFNVSEGSTLAPDMVQKVFFESPDTAARKEDKKPSTVFYKQPKARTQKDTDKFKMMLTTYSRKAMDDQSIKDPYAKCVS